MISWRYLSLFTLVGLSCSGYSLTQKLENPCGTSCPDGTSNTSAIFMFAAGPTTGNLAALGGGNARAGANSLCIAARPGYMFPNNSCTNVAGFISLSGTDSIQNMPTNHGVPTNRPIKGPTGIVIDNSWAEILDGSILTDLTAAGVLGVEDWWSFSGTNGATSNDCVDGTDGNPTPNTGIYGANGSTGATWIQVATTTCNTNIRILCLCY